MKQFLLFSSSQMRVVHWSDTLDDALDLQRRVEQSLPNEVIMIFQFLYVFEVIVTN